MFISFWSSVSHYNLKRESKSVQKSRDFRRVSVINCKVDLQIHDATKKVMRPIKIPISVH